MNGAINLKMNNKSVLNTLNFYFVVYFNVKQQQYLKVLMK